MSDDRVYFFGCLHDKGHFLHKRGESKRLSPVDGMPFKSLDGPFSPKSSRKQGAAKLTHIDGWTVLDIHDYTVDARGGAHAEFIIRGTYSEVGMLKLAARDWPAVVTRIGAVTVVERDPAAAGTEREGGQ